MESFCRVLHAVARQLGVEAGPERDVNEGVAQADAGRGGVLVAFPRRVPDQNLRARVVAVASPPCVVRARRRGRRAVNARTRHDSDPSAHVCRRDDAISHNIRREVILRARRGGAQRAARRVVTHIQMTPL